MTKLTEKQERFLCNIVYKGMSQRKAYREAYQNFTMKDASIDAAANKLLKSTKVLLRLEEMKNEKEGEEIFDLTLKEEKFVEALILGDSQRQAYKKAYNCRKFSDKTVDEKASRLFKSGKVQARYKQLKKRALKAAEDGTIMEHTEMMRRLSDTARSNLGDVLQVEVDERGSVDIRMRKDFDLTNVKEIYLDRSGNLRVKMQDPVNAMVKLADITKGAREMERESTANHVRIEIADNGEGYQG